jgi:uncharacterized metal-binding protein YceD (DUF177 family)
MSDEPILSRPVDLSEIGEGLTRTVEADAAEREALAKEFGLRELKSLVAEVKLSPLGRSGVLAEGHVSAEVVQICVVSLVPVDQTIDENFSVRFAKGPAADIVPPKAGAEIQIDAGASDPPEVLKGSTIDLGPLVTEYFVLGIDPYPRAPGAVLPAEATDRSAGEDSPFAALAALKAGKKGPG